MAEEYKLIENGDQFRQKYFALVRAALSTPTGQELLEVFKGMLMNPVANPSQTEAQARWNEGRNSVFREFLYACQEKTNE